jgi:hypothetical protein
MEYRISISMVVSLLKLQKLIFLLCCFKMLFIKAGETQTQETMKEEPLSQSLLGKTQINFIQYLGMFCKVEYPFTFILFSHYQNSQFLTEIVFNFHFSYLPFPTRSDV